MNRRLKTWLFYQRSRVLRATGLLWLAKRRMAKKGVVVLTFHRVLPDDEFAHTSSLPGIVVRQQTFERFMAWASQSCDIIDLGKGVPSWDVSAPRPRIALTLDDGWLDNYEVLRRMTVRHRATATIFICPGMMARRFPFWPERVISLLKRVPEKCRLAGIFDGVRDSERADSVHEIIEQLKDITPTDRDKCLERLEDLSVGTIHDSSDEPLNCTMTWEQVQDLQEQGITFGSHTVTHPILTQIPAEAARSELIESRQRVEKELGAPCRMFAYPNGNNNEEVRECAAAAGYSIAFTTQPGCWTRTSEPLRVPRINVSDQKLADPWGRFSPAMAEYALFWHSSAAEA
jgi:peptidoglycan/xylan/chitin deacetylase (PgdA/CDA1 family)